MVGEDVFQRAGDSPKFIFSYTVTDQLGNGPDTDSPYSGAVEVDVHLRETRLVAPDLAEDPDDPSDDPTTIDLAKLGSKDLTVLVHAFAPLWQPNDKIRVTYTATKPDAPVESHTVEADVGRIPFTYKLMVPNAKVIAGSVARAKYELVRGGVTIATSKTATANVIGGSTIVLLPPFLVAPAVDPIDVLAYPNGVTVRIEYLEAQNGDRARLVVDPPAGSPQFPLVEFNSDKQVDTVLSAAFLAARQGKVIEFRWNLNRNGGQAGKSPVATFSVLKIADGDSRLPTPNIADNTSDVLEVKELMPDARILAQKWLLFEPGQPLWVTCSGFDKNDNPVSKDVRSGEPNDSVDGLSVAAPVEWLKELKDGTELKITCAVNLDGSAIKANAVTFPLRSYGIKNISPPLHENFDDTPTQIITVGQRIALSSMTITFLSGTGQMGISDSLTYPPIPGKRSGQLLHLCYQPSTASQRCRIDLKSAYSKVSFWQTWTNTTTNTAFFYNTAGQLLGERTFTLSAADAHLVEFTSNGITRIEILCNTYDWIALDYFSFTP